MSAITASEIRRPASLSEARDAMLAGGTILFCGGGTKLGWGPPPESVDALVRTSAMDRLLVHNAADATVKVQAGMPLRRLQDELAEARQWIAIDAVGGPDATIGGIFACDDAGPQRLAYGTLRDHVIGVTMVLADGTVARSGGFVIKNVAGYDLGRLLCGSFGTLAFVAEINLKVHPRPQCTVTLRASATPESAVQAATAVSAAALEPVALDLAEDMLWLRFAGRPEVVYGQVRRAQNLLDVEVDVGLQGDILEDDTADWDRLTRELGGEEGETVVRVGTLPTHLPSFANVVIESADEAGVDATLATHVAVGAHTVRIRGATAAAHARFITLLRQQLGQLPVIAGHAVVRRRIADLEQHVDLWGRPPPGSVSLMRAIKAQLDPERRLAPGRFVGGI